MARTGPAKPRLQLDLFLLGGADAIGDGNASTLGNCRNRPKHVDYAKFFDGSGAENESPEKKKAKTATTASKKRKTDDAAASNDRKSSYKNGIMTLYGTEKYQVGGDGYPPIRGLTGRSLAPVVYSVLPGPTPHASASEKAHMNCLRSINTTNIYPATSNRPTNMTTLYQPKQEDVCPPDDLDLNCKGLDASARTSNASIEMWKQRGVDTSTFASTIRGWVENLNKKLRIPEGLLPLKAEDYEESKVCSPGFRCKCCKVDRKLNYKTNGTTLSKSDFDEHFGFSGSTGAMHIENQIRDPQALQEAQETISGD